MFPRIEYLEWVGGRPGEADFDLGSSGLRIAGDPLERFAEMERAGQPLEEQLAAAYGVEPEAVLVSAGATHGVLLATAAAIERGDRVLVESPGYEPLAATPRGLGARIDRFERTPESDYALDPAAVESALSAETALIVATDRHNPSGRRADRSAVRSAAGVAREAGARLLIDEVYAPFGRPGADDPGFGSATAAGLDGTVIASSLTKFFGLGGLRIGWIVAEPSFVDRAREVAAHVPTVAPTSVELAARAFETRATLAADARDRIAENVDALAAFADEREDLVGAVRPGSTLAFLGHERADGDEIARAAWERGVLVVPGRFFGDPDRVRISVAGPPAVVEDGLEAFGRALNSL